MGFVETGRVETPRKPPPAVGVVGLDYGPLEQAESFGVADTDIAAAEDTQSVDVENSA